MSKETSKIRLEVRKILNEFMNGGGGWDSNNDISLFHGYPSGVQNFPYEDSNLPEDIVDLNKEKAKRQNGAESYVEMSKNQDMYDFPFDEFSRGLKIEKENAKQYAHHTSILDIAKVVLEKLSDDPRYYFNIDKR